MKFNFNRSIGWNLEMQKVEISERIFNGPDCYHWREVFALWPVKTIGGKYVWLRKVYKQRSWAVWGKGFHMEPTVEYAELFDILTEV
jgi:hypothetical protein